MKKLFIVLVLVCLMFSNVFANEEKYVEEVKNLNKQILELKKIIDEQRIKIQSLKDTCKRYELQMKQKENVKEPKDLEISIRNNKKDSNSIVVKKPIFGIYLGENIRELEKRMKFTYFGQGDENITKYWKVNSVDKNIKNIFIATIDERVLWIQIYFKDASESNYDVIKKELIKKYKTENNDGLLGELFGERSFNATIDNVDINIYLNRDIGFMEDDTLTLMYMHSFLTLKSIDEEQKIKANKVSNDL